MSQPQEFYRYAAPGERQLKFLHGNGQQQVRYLPGVEIRSCAQQRLRVITTGNSHIYQTGSQNIAHFNLADRLGSLNAVLDEQGSLVSRETWYPFGGTASWLTGAQAGAALKFQRYAGKERDATGLIFFGWRCYVPWKMRWLNCDPAGTLDGLNLFCMVRNNPLTLRDRDGRVGEEAPLPPKKRYLKNFSAVPQAEAEEITLPPSSPQPPPPVASVAEVNPEIPQPGPSYVPEPDASKVTKGKVCPQCNLTCNTSYLLEKHIRMENNDPLICDICSKSCFHKYDLSRHKLIHSHEKPHACQYPNCEQNFKTTSERAAHVRRVHKTDGNYDCNICDKNFTSEGKLKDHIWGVHNNKKRYYCKHCSFSCKKLPKLEKHKEMKNHRF